MIKNEGEGARREGKHEQRLGVTQPGFVTWFTAFKEGGAGESEAGTASNERSC